MSRKSKWVISITIFLIILVGLSIFYFMEKQKITATSSFEAQQTVTKDEVKNLVAKISKLIGLPKEEEPIVATIVNVEALSKEQPFYANAHDGDKVLVYLKTQKAIIYDPKQNILVNVGPIFANQNQNINVENNLDPIAEQKNKIGKINIEIRNGTNEPTKGMVVANELSRNEGFKIIAVESAKKSNYEKNILIDLSNGTKKEIIIELEKIMGVNAIKALPKGEPDTKAEVLLIIGAEN